jgi:hypothetical protein
MPGVEAFHAKDGAASSRNRLQRITDPTAHGEVGG